MELVSSSRSVLSSCNRLVAPSTSRTASAAARRHGKSLVCVLGGDTNGEFKIGKRAALALFFATPTLSLAFSAHSKTKTINPYDERRLLQQNKKIQEANRAPDDFPNFIREGFQVKVVTPDNYITRDSGLIYEDVKVGTGDCPKDGQQVGPSTFFSAKQFEVFDVELLSVQDCQRRTIAFYSDVVCT
uniref:Uncharacterized protein n=1 Tax=Hordeum vulgare subsp. vulgare TaxID=112509 RepID=A0A8I6YPN4_HORVV